MKTYIISALLIATSSVVSANEQRHAGVHAHGVNQVQLMLNQERLSVMYQMPMVQLNAKKHDDGHEEHGMFAFLEGLFGHDEHEDHDHNHGHEHDEVEAPEHLDEKMATFKNYQQLFVLPKAADCHLERFTSELHSVSSESTHKDIELSYQFECHHPNALNSIEFSAFKHFELGTIMMQSVINNKASAKTIQSAQQTSL